MNVLFKVLLVLLIINMSKSDIVAPTASMDKVTKPPSNVNQGNNDRFLQDLDDEEWHVAHLKHIEFEGRRDCMGDTFADKARRYRKTLRNDGARVMFVSADPIPFNESDLYEDSCKVDEETDNLRITPFSTEPAHVYNHTIMTDSLIITDVLFSDYNNSGVANVTSVTSPLNATVTSPVMDYKATIPSIVPKEDSQEEINSFKKNTGSNAKRRASEYMFSSVEYYDEIPNFDASICPDGVDVIELEIDQLRRYDVECEMIMEWRSLRD